MCFKLLKHLNSVGELLRECRQDGVDSIKEDWSLGSSSWSIAEALVNHSHERMVIANFMEILCPAINFRDWNHCIWVLWIGTKSILRKWPPSTEGVDNQDTIGVDVNL